MAVELTEFQVGEFNYQIKKLTVFQQLAIAKRIAPLLPPMIPLMEGGKDRADLSALMQPMADALTSMKDEDLEKVVDICMSALKRQKESSWLPVWNSAAHMAMFEDLYDLSAVLPMVVRVIQDSLSNFTAGLLTSR